MIDILDLGHGHKLHRVVQNGEPWGFVDYHQRKDQPELACTGGSVPLTGMASGDTWDQTGEWPAITLTPSLLCTQCGEHGFVREGQWVPS